MTAQMKEAMNATATAEKRKLQETALEIMIEGLPNFAARRGIYDKRLNTFEFADHPHKEKTATRLLIIFHGNDASSLRIAADNLFNKRYRIRSAKANKHLFEDQLTNALDVPLERVKPVAPDVLQKRLALRGNGANGNGNGRDHLTPDDAFRKDPRNQAVLDIIQKFHDSQLLRGVRNRKAPYVFVEGKELAVEFNYIDEDESLYVLDLCPKLLGGYSPSIRKGKQKGEEVVLQYRLSDIKPEKIDQRMLRQRSRRKLEGVDAVKVTEFVFGKILRIERELMMHDKAGFATFRATSEAQRTKVLEYLTGYSVVYLASEKDNRCFWVAVTASAESQFEQPTKLPPSETIRIMVQVAEGENPGGEDEVVDRKQGYRSILRLVKDEFGWDVPEQCSINQRVDERSSLVYVAVSPKGDEERSAKLKEKYPTLKAKLPAEVKNMAFQDFRGNSTNTLYFYFVTNAKLHALRKQKGGGGKAPRAEKSPEPPPSPAAPLTQLPVEQAVNVDTDGDSMTHVKMFLGMWGSMSEHQKRDCMHVVLSGRDEKAEKLKYLEGFKASLDGHIILRSNDATKSLAEHVVKDHVASIDELLKGKMD